MCDIKFPSAQDTAELRELLYIMHDLGIPAKHIATVEEVTQPNASRTYHNVYHCISVAVRAYKGAIHYGLPARNLVLAGLYHDAAHPGLSPDALNIERALDTWGKDDDVARLIKATEFPGVQPEALDEKIIRDADIVQAITDPTGQWNLRLVGESSNVDLSVAWVRQHVVTEWGLSLLPDPYKLSNRKVIENAGSL